MVILEDQNTAFRYSSNIIREHEDQEMVQTASIIEDFVTAHKNKQLKQYLRSSIKSSEVPEYQSGELNEIYGANFIEKVVEEREKNIFLMSYKKNCALCIAYYEYL